MQLTSPDKATVQADARAVIRATLTDDHDGAARAVRAMTRPEVDHVLLWTAGMCAGLIGQMAVMFGRDPVDLLNTLTGGDG